MIPTERKQALEAAWEAATGNGAIEIVDATSHHPPTALVNVADLEQVLAEHKRLTSWSALVNAAPAGAKEIALERFQTSELAQAITTSWREHADRLRWVATGQIPHAGGELCPSAVAPEKRNRDCPACQAIGPTPS